MKITLCAGGVVKNPEGKVLLVKQGHNNSWSLPKGHIEKDEDEFTAAKREIYEESGVSELTLIKQLPLHERHVYLPDGTFDLSAIKRISLFLFSAKQTKLSPMDPDNPEARWVDKEEVSKLLTYPKDKEYFESVKNQI